MQSEAEKTRKLKKLSSKPPFTRARLLAPRYSSLIGIPLSFCLASNESSFFQIISRSQSSTTQMLRCSLRDAPGIVSVAWLWEMRRHSSGRHRDCFGVLSVCLKAASLKEAQGLVRRGPRGRHEPTGQVRLFSCTQHHTAMGHCRYQ